MFKCAICGKEYSDKDMNEMRLLNRGEGELETFHVCTTCLDNKEDMVAYLAEKKSMSIEEARHLYDYFLPLLPDIESPLLAKYIEVRMRSLRTKLADNLNEPTKEDTATTKNVAKKKRSVFQRLKISLVALDAIISISIFVIMTIISAINPIITAASVVMGIILGIAVFVGGYFAIDSYIRMREDTSKVLKKVVLKSMDDDIENEESEETDKDTK